MGNAPGKSGIAATGVIGQPICYLFKDAFFDSHGDLLPTFT
jgi:hypothetical protein